VNTFVIQIIRTVIPLAVAFVVSLLARIAIPIDPAVVDELSSGLGLLVASLYYIGVAWLERRWAWFGWLLGVARNPVYAPLEAPSSRHRAI
jgi:hypothetical protein